MRRSIKNKLFVSLLFVLLTVQCGVPRRPALDPGSENFYHRARHLFTKSERKIFNNLGNEERRREFIRYFWEIRDPDPLTEVNEFKEEIEERFEFVSLYLKEGGRPGWDTDRGRIYMILGAPDYIDPNVYTEDPVLKGRIIHWFYGLSDSVDSDYTYAGTEGMFFRFIDKDGYGFYRLDILATPLRTFDVVERMKYNYINSSEGRIFQFGELDFEYSYDEQSREFRIQVKPRYLEFEEKKGMMISRLNFDLVLFAKTEKITRISQRRSFEYKKEELLNMVSPISFSVSLPPQKEDVIVDAILTDLNANIKARKVYEIKSK
jgi:GWxTD domain-containing protein